MRPPQRSGLRATMIHDLGPLRFPERLHPRTVRMHTATAREARTCDLVFVNSRFTAGDVAERLGVPSERIRLAYPGVGPEFSADGPRFDGGAPYVFTTATADWRKHLQTLRAAEPRAGGRARRTRLAAPPPVHVGGDGPHSSAELR